MRGYHDPENARASGARATDSGSESGWLMNKETVRARIEEIGIIPAIRLASAEDALFAVRAVADCGIPIAEVTMTIPGAIQVISELVRDRPELIVGAGTIVDTETARRCLDAGAMFLSSPGLDVQIVEFAVKQNVVVFPGALTPSEIMAAWKAGSDFRQGVSLFPAGRRQLHPSSQVAIPPRAVDRVRRRDAREYRRFHPGGSGGGGNWPGFDQSGGCPAAGAGLDSRTGGAFPADRQAGA